jgi:hypothetical protein
MIRALFHDMYGKVPHKCDNKITENSREEDHQKIPVINTSKKVDRDRSLEKKDEIRLVRPFFTNCKIVSVMIIVFTSNSGTELFDPTTTGYDSDRKRTLDVDCIRGRLVITRIVLEVSTCHIRPTDHCY